MEEKEIKECNEPECERDPRPAVARGIPMLWLPTHEDLKYSDNAKLLSKKNFLEE